MNLKLMFSQPGFSHKSLFSTGFLVPLRFIVMIRHTLGHQTSPSIPLILHLGDFATSPGVEWSKRPREVRDDKAHDALFFATLARACQIYSQESYTRLQEFHSHSIWSLFTTFIKIIKLLTLDSNILLIAFHHYSVKRFARTAPAGMGTPTVRRGVPAETSDPSLTS